MPKNRVLHAHITDDTHEKLTRICSELGCSVADYVIGVWDKSFEDSRCIEPPMPRSQSIVKKVSYDDGKMWIEIPEIKNTLELSLKIETLIE